jgi:hypothetical protein
MAKKIQKDEDLKHYATVFAAKQKMETLKSAIYDFNLWWKPKVIEAMIWPIPVAVKPTAENVPWMPALEYIEFETVTGEEAIALAAQALINFYRYPEDPALNIRRWAGFVLIAENFREDMLLAIENINTLKTELMMILSVIPDGSRPIVLKKTFPREHILAAYRHIHAASKQVRTLAFTWQGKVPKNTPISKEKIIEQLLIEQQTAIDNEDNTTKTIREKEIALITSLADDSKLIERKSYAPSPRLLGFYCDSQQKTGVADIMNQAPLPFFMAQDKMPEIKPLNNWSIEQEKPKSGKQSLDYYPILPRLRIFTYFG